MASRLADAEESERRQLARELHDRVGQNLTALSINLNILGGQSPIQGPGKARLDDCLALLSDMTDSIRNVMGQLRPALLDEYGLLAALREYCGRLSRRIGIEVKVQGDGSGTGFRPASETAMFRIAQEALNNVAKHARAQRVTVSVTCDNGIVRMAISDDGEGFTVDGASRSYCSGLPARLGAHDYGREGGGHRGFLPHRIGARQGYARNRGGFAMTITVALADDHRVVREGLRALLSATTTSGWWGKRQTVRRR